MAANVKDLEELANHVINPFFNTLGISHTKFYTEMHPDFYLLKSLFSSRDITTPKLNHIGVEFAQSSGGCVVRTVLEGYPAQRSGIRRGDIVVSANGEPFHPIRSFQSSSKAPQEVLLRIRRNAKELSISVLPIYESIHQSYLHAMSNSVKTYRRNGQNIGYIHLWTGTNDLILAEFERLLASKFSDVDSLILDLRDGMGGAWYS